MNLGNNIKKLRNLKNMTQEDLAEILNTTSKSVSRWEQEITYPDISLLPLIANVFEVSVDELLGVENIKQDEYVKKIKKKANDFQKINDYDNELRLWNEAYQKFQNNEEIKIGLINIMQTINIMTNDLKYEDKIIKIAESILEKSTNNLIRINAVSVLVNLYSQMDNLDMADFYAKMLPKDYFLTYDVMKTRYLNENELISLVQNNIGKFISEIERELEIVMSRAKLSNEYKKECLERLIQLEKVVYVKEEDYGSSALSIIFNYFNLIKLEVKTTNDKEKVLEYLKEIKKALDYVINFTPHSYESPFMNKMRCESIGSYMVVMNNLKEELLKCLNSNELEEYKFLKEYQELFNETKKLK